MKYDNIEPQKMTLGELFDEKEKQFCIPAYQRPYEWKEKQIENLLNNLINAYENQRNDIYMVGTLQFSQTDKNCWEIIDGHQRITTFYLILDCLGETPKIKYHNEINNSDSIDSLIEQDALYKENYNYIKKFLDDQKSTDKNDLLEFLKNNVVFISIIIKKDGEKSISITDTLQIFDALNTTGLSLDIKDIFKIKFYDYSIDSLSQSTDKTEFFNKINEAYKAVCKPIENESDEKIYDLSEDDLLDTCRFYIISKTKTGFYARVMKDSNNAFFETYFKKDKQSQEFKFTLDTFCKIADCINQTQNLLHDRDAQPKNKSEIIKCCSRELTRESGYGKLKNLYYYLIFIQSEKTADHKVSEEMLQNADEIMTCVWKYCSVYRIICAKVINDVFNKIGDIVFANDKNMDNIKSAAGNLLQSIDEKSRDYSAFKELFTEKGNVYGCNKPHLFLQLSYIDDIDCTDNNSELYSVYKIKKDLFYREKWNLNIEHILSRSLHDEEYVNSIGNLMYLTDRTNKSLGEKTKEIARKEVTIEDKYKKDFESKIEKYEKDENLVCVKTFLQKYRDVDFISKRNEEKIEFLKDLYNDKKAGDN